MSGKKSENETFGSVGKCKKKTGQLNQGMTEEKDEAKKGREGWWWKRLSRKTADQTTPKKIHQTEKKAFPPNF